MSLKSSLNQGSLKKHRTSAQEIEDLLEVIERDLKDAGIKSLSVDRNFTTAYNAALQAATVVLCCRGYATQGIGHHVVTFKALRGLDNFKEQARYFDGCRKRRNRTDYIIAGNISEKEAKELFKEAKIFYKGVRGWVKKNYPKYCP